MWIMPRQPEMSPHWLDCVHLAWLGGTTQVSREPVSEGRMFTLPTLTHIGWCHLTALTIVLLTEGQVHSLVSAGDGAGDADCLVGDWAGVGGDNPWLTVLAQSTVTPLVTLSETFRLDPGALAVFWWREFGSYQDISQVFSSGKGQHGGEGHVLSGIYVTIQQTLVTVSYPCSNVW